MPRDIRPGTIVSVKVPVEEPLPLLCDIKTGAWFGLNGDPEVYVKTDETLGRGYRCFCVSNGKLKHINSDTRIDKIYHTVGVTVK